MAEEKGKNEKGQKPKKAETRKDMKPALAVWALLAKSSIYKVFAILAVMVSAELLLFYNSIKTEWENYTEYNTLAGAIAGSHSSLIFLAALGLMYFMLAWTEGRLETKSGAVMRRLRLSGSRLFAIKTAYNTACLAVLFIAQIWLCIFLVEAYGRETAEELYASPQRLFLAFYQIDFLHCMLPMAEVGKWVRNLLLLLAFGMEAAAGAGKTEKKSYVPLIPLYVLTASWFVRPVGVDSLDIICDVVYMIAIAVHVRQAWKAEEKHVRLYVP